MTSPLADALRAQARALLVLADAAEQSPPTALVDELLPIGSCGLERSALRRLEREGRVTLEKHGRRKYVRRSALAAITTAAPTSRKLSLAERAAAAARSAA